MEPAPPADDAGEAAVATYDLQVVLAGRDCRRKLAAVERIVALPTVVAGEGK